MTSVHSASSEVADCLVWYCVDSRLSHIHPLMFFSFIFFFFLRTVLGYPVMPYLLITVYLYIYISPLYIYISPVPLAAPSGISAFCIRAGLGTVVVFCQMPCVYKQELCSCVGVCFK